MKETLKRLLCIAMMAVFVNFMFANTVFMHTHTLNDGSRVTHSHPYVPASHHGHTGSQAGSIAQANAMAGGFELPMAVALQPARPQADCPAPAAAPACPTVAVFGPRILRAPPAGL